MEAVPPVRYSLLGILLLVVKLSVLLVQNRIHLYNFLLLKIVFFNRWLSGLAQEAWGSCSPEAHPPPGLAASPVGRVLRAGLARVAVPVWPAWAGVLGCVRASGLAWKQLGLSAATCRELLLSCLHSLTPVVLLLLLLTRRLCQRAHGRSVVWLLSKALLDKCAVPELLALLKHLYWWVENAAALTSWHLAYLVAWTACLASRLLQAAFEHTAQLAQAQEIEPQEGSGPVSESPTP
ncbi:transmembrane protein 270 [Lynx rufus]|uniref:transmembrane protein 270 n=1 Tax=Lynx rufus TaxID=61384 RepID=UPI001F12625C|nr:transmembrane protein 270 [Lynx rufus]